MNVNDILAEIEAQMRGSLAGLLAAAVGDSAHFWSSAAFDPETFLQWLDRYPTQLVVLSGQVRALSLSLSLLLAQ